MSMQDHFNSPEASAVTAIFFKFLPATLGAGFMILIEPPKTRKELFWRLVAAFVCSSIFGEPVMDFLDSLIWLSFLDPAKRSHQAAVDFIVGGSGWFVLGGAGVWLRKWRGDPAAAAEEAKKVLP